LTGGHLDVEVRTFVLDDVAQGLIDVEAITGTIGPAPGFFRRGAPKSLERSTFQA
jgi:hypothetical protein